MAADIAVVLTERGLGGNDVDLGHRIDKLRRDRSRRAEDARALARRWADRWDRDSRQQETKTTHRSPGALLALTPTPIGVARNRGGDVERRK